MTKLEGRLSKILIPPEGKRITFRPLTMEDADRWFDFLLSDQAMKFFTFPRTHKEAKAWISRQIMRYENRGDGLLAVLDKNSGELLGQCGLLWQDVENEELLEVGYSFLPEYWGRGYATEAAALSYNLGFERELAQFIVSVIHEDNLASQRVAEKNGLKIWKSTTWKELPVDVWRINKSDWEI